MSKGNLLMVLAVILIVASIPLAIYNKSFFVFFAMVIVGGILLFVGNSFALDDYKKNVIELRFIRSSMQDYIRNNEKWDGSKSSMDFMKSVNERLEDVLNFGLKIKKPENLYASAIQGVLDNCWRDIEAAVVRERGDYKSRLNELDEICGRYFDQLIGYDKNSSNIMRLRETSLKNIEKISRKTKSNWKNDFYYEHALRKLRMCIEDYEFNSCVKRYAEDVGYSEL